MKKNQSFEKNFNWEKWSLQKNLGSSNLDYNKKHCFLSRILYIELIGLVLGWLVAKNNCNSEIFIIIAFITKVTKSYLIVEVDEIK